MNETRNRMCRVSAITVMYMFTKRRHQKRAKFIFFVNKTQHNVKKSWIVCSWQAMYLKGFEICCGAGLCAITLVPKLSIASATHNNSESDACEDVTWRRYLRRQNGWENWNTSISSSHWPLLTVVPEKGQRELCSRNANYTSLPLGPSVTWDDLWTSDEFIIIVII